MFVVGGMVGAMGGGYVADRLGRRRGLIFAQVSHSVRIIYYLTQGLKYYRCTVKVR
jgi:MFS family permease